MEARTELNPSRFVVTPNRSLSWKGNQIFLASLAILSFGIAGAFAAAGFWVVLPFAGLEMLALATVLYICSIRSEWCELIAIDADKVQIKVGRRKPSAEKTLQTAWSKVELRPANVLGHPSRLLICSKGEEIEVGACLVEEERIALAKSLKRAIQGHV